MFIPQSKYLILFLGFFHFTLFASDFSHDQLILPEMIIEANIDRSTFTNIDFHHDFQPLKLPADQGYYFPTFKKHNFQLPSRPPQNIRIGWMADSFLGGLAWLFQGKSGQIQYAINQLLKNQIDTAEEELREIAQTPNHYQNTAMLWLAWLMIEKKQTKDSYQIAQQLQKSADLLSQQEGYYLESYLLFNNYAFEKVVNLLQKIRNKYGEQFFNFRLNYIYLISLLNLEKWSIAEKVVTNLALHYSYSPYYSALLEIQGQIAYEQKQYTKSIQYYQRLLQIQPNYSLKNEIFRRILWIIYKSKNYQYALQLITKSSLLKLLDEEEANYLHFLLSLKLGLWKNVRQIFLNFSKTSQYYPYAVLQILHYGPKSPRLYYLYNELANQKFKQDSLDSYSFFIKANQLFKKEKYQEAEQQYLKAVQKYSDQKRLWILKYNLGLSYIKQGKYEDAYHQFTKIKNQHTKYYSQTVYYRMVCLFYLKKYSEIIKLKDDIQLELISPNFRSEIDLVLGTAYFKINDDSHAIQLFQESWEKFNNNKALFIICQFYYFQQEYQKIILLTEKLSPKTYPKIFQYYIKSLTALSKNQEALNRIKNLAEAEYLPLWLILWNSNQNYQTVIDKTSEYLANSEIKDDQRLFYYLVAGYAYFSLKEYQKSEKEFYKAINIAKSEQKSLIYFNILLANYFNSTFLIFETKAHFFLSQDLIPQAQYLITNLLVTHYMQTKEYLKADQVLANYLKNNFYQEDQFYLIRLDALYKAHKYQTCFQLAQQTFTKEKINHQIQRLIFLGRSGNASHQSQKVIQKFTEAFQNPVIARNNYLKIIFAHAYSLKKQYSHSTQILTLLKNKKLSKDLNLKIDLILAYNYLHQNQCQKVTPLIDKIDKFYAIHKYYEALQIQLSCLRKKKKNITAIIKTLLKIAYHPQSNLKKKHRLLLEITGLYKKLGQKKRAHVILKNIQLKYLSRSLHKKYKKLRRRLL